MSASAKKKLLQLADKRLEKFVSLVPRVLISDRPDKIHETRVWSRRLQQVFHVLFSKPAVGKNRKLIRMLRKTRRSLGVCRNLDVTIDLVQKKIDAAKDSAVRDAWRQVQAYLQERRAPELDRARQRLSRCDVMAFIRRARAALESGDREKNPETLLKKSIEQGLTEWYDALDKARQNQGQANFHGFRIAGKRLRYRLELLATMGNHSANSRVASLKKLQDEIGQWHDRQIMLQFVADFISRPDFLADHADLGRTLLAEMDNERRRDNPWIESILQRAQRMHEDWETRKTRRRSKQSNG